MIALNSSGAYGAAKLWPVEHCGHAGPADRRGNWITTCWCCAGRGSAAAAAEMVRQAGLPAGVHAAGRCRRAGGDQGLPGAVPAAGLDRQRAAARRRRAGQAGDHAAGPDPAGLDREPDGRGQHAAGGFGLSGLRQADLPAWGITAACASCCPSGCLAEVAAVAGRDRCWKPRDGTVSLSNRLQSEI